MWEGAQCFTKSHERICAGALHAPHPQVSKPVQFKSILHDLDAFLAVRFSAEYSPVFNDVVSLRGGLKAAYWQTDFGPHFAPSVVVAVAWLLHRMVGVIERIKPPHSPPPVLLLSAPLRQ